MTRYHLLLIKGFLLLSGSALATDKSDSTHLNSVNDFIRNGHFHGHLRNYFMATDNSGSLTDYHAYAFGAGIGYKSTQLYGFQIGFSGFFIFNVFSNDLGALDPISNARSRYELGNFDLENPGNHKDMDRLEELYIRYTFHDSHITVGRQNLKTPFINPQDGRMRPSLEEGFWMELNEIPKLKVQGGWLYAMSPRSTKDWFSVGESIGVYPVGRGADGLPSGYKGNVESRGVAIGSVQFAPVKALQWEAWQYYVENVFALSFTQLETTLPLNEKLTLILGGQLGYQQAVGEGGNANPALRYIEEGSENYFMSFRAGWKNARWSSSVNYTKIGDQNRFLMPREWGVEPFYTFMPRERMEGSAASQAFVVKNSFKPDSQWKWSLEYGHFYLPDVQDVARNKYTMPSYFQLNLSGSYEFSGLFEGFNLQALYVYKGALGNTYGEGRYVMNKVNMSNYNLIVNYHF
ncbi:OprD family outer membrane porin [Cytophagales bacterium LB-30]|uniref:OprD family outer membrane porin n=1 Tax=Shiella aurantiaca TaxID=3058365 RepID=A0ABT8F2Y0_9BACT|nr:OprD family outer membrane porin [Shiella aurantiaca]MDN4164806.1 OprD family outer membrane porin [Shiella aurantiaca]